MFSFVPVLTVKIPLGLDVPMPTLPLDAMRTRSLPLVEK